MKADVFKSYRDTGVTIIKARDEEDLYFAFNDYNDWNGEEHLHGWLCNEYGTQIGDKKDRYVIKKISKPVGEPDEDGEYASYELDYYEVEKRYEA